MYQLWLLVPSSMRLNCFLYSSFYFCSNFPFSVVVLGNFRRFYFPTLLIHSSELQFFPFLREFFNAPFRAFFVEKIFRVCYNNSTL